MAEYSSKTVYRPMPCHGLQFYTYVLQHSVSLKLLCTTVFIFSVLAGIVQQVFFMCIAALSIFGLLRVLWSACFFFCIFLFM